ncbi:Serine/threonine-protein kinase [Dirofilaria immitis]
MNFRFLLEQKNIFDESSTCYVMSKCELSGREHSVIRALTSVPSPPTSSSVLLPAFSSVSSSAPTVPGANYVIPPSPPTLQITENCGTAFTAANTNTSGTSTYCHHRSGRILCDGYLRLIEVLRVNIAQLRNLPTRNIHSNGNGSNNNHINNNDHIRPITVLARLDTVNIFQSTSTTNGNVCCFGDNFVHEISNSFSQLHFLISENVGNRLPRQIGLVSIRKRDIVKYSGEDRWYRIQAVNRQNDVSGQICIDIHCEPTKKCLSINFLVFVDKKAGDFRPVSFQYPLGVNSLPRTQIPLATRDREKSFVAYFGAGMSGSGTVNRPGRAQDTNQVQVNVNPNPVAANNGLHSDSDAPEIRKYKKKFSGDILCAALWGVNLLIGTDSGLMLLDRSGQGKVYQLITRRRFEQMTVLEGQNILVTISGRKRRIRVYYLSWLKQKILRTEGVSGIELEKRNGWVNVGDLQGAVHFKIVRYERIKFLVVGLESTVEIYAWAPKPYHKFMAFKAFSQLTHLPLIVDLTVEKNSRLKVLYGSREGFHAIDLDSGSIDDIYTPANTETVVTPHCIVILPNSNGMQLLLCYNNEGVYVSTYGKATKSVFLQWGETPSSVAYISTGQIMGWGNKAIEIRSVDTGHLDGVFMHKKAQKLKFLCERNDKVFFSSAKGGGACQIYFMTLNKPGLSNW